MEFTVRPIVEDDWRELKALRLEMLADTPMAYLETLESAQREPDATWQIRAAKPAIDGSLRVAAIDANGRWIGSLGAFQDRDLRVWLVGVYVQKSWRGPTGVFDSMLDAAESWAAQRASSLLLEVHEDNSRAINAYFKRGFVETGNTVPYPLNESQREIEMIKSLR